MALTVYSPHSGRPVMVREQDLGRALRDEGGRVFYALQTADGQGVYGAVTRKGSPEEEARYENQAWRLTPEQLAAEEQTTAQSTTTDTPHDATGPGRKAPVSRYIVITGLAALIAAVGYRLYQRATYTCPNDLVPPPLERLENAAPATSDPAPTDPALSPATPDGSTPEAAPPVAD